jgi:hypothetical protein
MPDDLLPELDTPPASGVFVDWEEEREEEAKQRTAARFVVDADPEVKPSIEAEGNLMGETIDVDDDRDNGL